MVTYVKMINDMEQMWMHSMEISCNVIFNMSISNWSSKFLIEINKNQNVDIEQIKLYTAVVITE